MSEPLSKHIPFLHERIRELEAELERRIAELSDTKHAAQELIDKQRARAEKAEASRDISIRIASELTIERDYWMEQKRLEDVAHGETLARVAELTKQRDAALATAEDFARQAGWHDEAREREAE